MRWPLHSAALTSTPHPCAPAGAHRGAEAAPQGGRGRVQRRGAGAAHRCGLRAAPPPPPLCSPGRRRRLDRPCSFFVHASNLYLNNQPSSAQLLPHLLRSSPPSDACPPAPRPLCPISRRAGGWSCTPPPAARTAIIVARPCSPLCHRDLFVRRSPAAAPILIKPWCPLPIRPIEMRAPPGGARVRAPPALPFDLLQRGTVMLYHRSTCK